MAAMAAELTELILDRAHNAAVLMDQQGLVTYWNPSAERIFGRSREDAVGRLVSELVIPERFRDAHARGFLRFLEEGVGPVLDKRIEMSALRADGSEFPVEMTISALRDRGQWLFHAFIQDISERSRGELEREALVDELRRTLRGTEQRFEAIVGSLSDPVTIRDREDRIVYANRAALDSLGFDSGAELRETPPASIMEDYVVRGADGREVMMEDIPSVRILRGEEAEPLLIRTVHRVSGALRWQLLKAAPLLDEAGETEATITIIEDVTERQRAEQQNEFLATASTALASSLDYEQTLRNVAELAVPDIADWCAVDLFDQHGTRKTVAVAHIDPSRLSLAEDLRSYEPERLDPEQGLGLVLATGEAQHYAQITDEMLAQAAVDDRHLELLRAVGFRSVLIVPMRVGGKVLGTMTLVSAESARAFDDVDLALAGQIATRAAVAIENSRLYSQRSLIARTLQQSLLPDQLPKIPGYQLASLYLPALETSMVGGDFYEIWPVADAWMMLIGDVTGKGIEAAALTALVRHTVRTASEFRSSPAELLRFLDATLKQRPQLSVCTALCLRLEGETALLAVGGHPLPLYLHGGEIRELGAHGPLLGAFPEADWVDHALVLEPDSTLLAYTDGVTDGQGERGERFGFERLRALLGELGDVPAPELLSGLAGRLEEFQAGAQTDDTAAIALRRLPAAVDRGESRGGEASPGANRLEQASKKGADR
jgi:PAS domain S-box-containing protein